MPKNVSTTKNQIYHNSLGDYTTITNTGAIGSNSTGVYSVVGTNGTGSNIGGGYSVAGTNGTTSFDWANVVYTNPSSINSTGTMELRGQNADIKINGRSLMDAIDALEQRLNILVPNPELEAEWDELRELGERYRELEKKCKEKGEMWKKLKSMPPPREE